MLFFSYIAALLLGVAFGLYFGRLLSEIFNNWESAAVSGKWFTTIGSFLIGGGTGVTIFQIIAPDALALYLIGLASSMIYTYFKTISLPIDNIPKMIEMSDTLRRSIPDIKHRIVLTMFMFFSKKEISRAYKNNSEEVERLFIQALDSQSSDPPHLPPE